ncbi:MgtC/SapB family protein [Novosphingobium nitrogenifigens]|nr:MgtC/SapB family protein [Novosphingobium sp. NBM11]
MPHIVSLAVAYALALPVGWDHERDVRSISIRTFSLVAIASCGFVLVGIAILSRTSPAQARFLEGPITGVGFIGGGAILKNGSKAVGHGDCGQPVRDRRARRGRRLRPV